MSDEDRSADLAAAFDKHEEADDTTETTEETTTAATISEQPETEVADPTTREQDTIEATETTATTEETTDAGTVDSDETTVDGTADLDKDTPKGDVVSAPAGWSPAAREKWGNIDPDLQQEIIRRESAYSAGIQKYAEAGKLGNAISEVLSPYSSIIAMEGADTVTAVQNLAQTAAVLRQGSPQQKAQLVYEIIGTYGVDVEMVDNMLAGEPVLSPEMTAFHQQIDQKLEPINNFMQGMRAHQQTAATQTLEQLNQENEAFVMDPANEFIDDVKADMADLLDLAANRGIDMSMKEAYDKACRMNPQVQEVLTARAKRQAMEEEQAKLKAKAAAASTVETNSSGSAITADPGDRAGALAAAWDKHAATG